MVFFCLPDRICIRSALSLNLSQRNEIVAEGNVIQANRIPSIVFCFFSFFVYISKTDSHVETQLGLLVVIMEEHSLTNMSSLEAYNGALFSAKPPKRKEKVGYGAGIARKPLLPISTTKVPSLYYIPVTDLYLVCMSKKQKTSRTARL